MVFRRFRKQRPKASGQDAEETKPAGDQLAAGDERGEASHKSAPELPEVDLAEAAELLARAVANLRSLIGEDQLDVRTRLTSVEERTGILEHLIGRVLADEDAGPGGEAASDESIEDALSLAGEEPGPPRRKKAKRPTGERRPRPKRQALPLQEPENDGESSPPATPEGGGEAGRGDRHDEELA